MWAPVYWGTRRRRGGNFGLVLNFNLKPVGSRWCDRPTSKQILPRGQWTSRCAEGKHLGSWCVVLDPGLLEVQDSDENTSGSGETFHLMISGAGAKPSPFWGDVRWWQVQGTQELSKVCLSGSHDLPIHVSSKGQAFGISLLCTFVHWLFIATPRGGQNYFPYLTDEEAKAQREVKRLAKATQLRSSISEVLVSLARLTLCDPMPGILCSPLGSSVHGILQARILEWVAIPFSRRSSRPRDQTHVFCIAGRFFTI